MTDDVLAIVGIRVKHARAGRNWTIRELAERSGVSVRFLVQVEAGKANISVRRLSDLAMAFGVPPSALLEDRAANEPPIIALLGLRGAGKTTVGKRLARRLHVPFVELDRLIEQAADMALNDIFAIHGEQHYRRLERQLVAEALAPDRPMVLATGGGIVTSPDAYAMLKASAVTVWLRATPEDHWNRVVSQGDKRPMADHPQAMADLRALLAARQPLYATADHTVDTTGHTVDEVVSEIKAELVSR